MSYDDTFYAYVEQGARRSANRVIPQLLSLFDANSILDVGCGSGAWLSVWQEHGLEIKGIDGDYVKTEQLCIPQQKFFRQDLENPFSLGEKFDVVQSLEVAEHLSESHSSDFVHCLCQHGDIVFFSAAPPGQGGHGHVNEKPYSFWQSLFEKQGYVALDILRPLIIHDKTIEPWYRFNSVVYIKKELLDEGGYSRYKEHVAQGSLADLSPPLYRFRKRLVALLPSQLGTLLAVLKEKLTMQKLRLQNKGK